MQQTALTTSSIDSCIITNKATSSKQQRKFPKNSCPSSRGHQHQHQDQDEEDFKETSQSESASLLCLFWFCARASRIGYSRLNHNNNNNNNKTTDLHINHNSSCDEPEASLRYHCDHFDTKFDRLEPAMSASSSLVGANMADYGLSSSLNHHNINKINGEHDQASKNRAKFAFKSYTIALHEANPKRGRSLVHDARDDTLRNRELLLRLTQDKSSMDDEPSVSVSGGPAGGSDELVASVRSLIEQQQHDYPRHVSQLDQCNHLLIKYEPELDPTHPGYHDLEYRERRKQVAQIAFDYRYGQPIPEVDYEPREVATWGYIYDRLKVAYAKFACRQHLDAIDRLESECGYSALQIPQLQRVSEFLFKTSGWRLRPAAGLLTARDFLASLAFRVFQTTQYIRHWGNPEHSVEPDCIHELMGHIPMLCDLKFANFSQQLGVASLGAPDEQIERFATLYWFTVEFGLCREGPDRELKCYGAGLLSSYGEMQHALESNVPALRDFEPEETALETYDDAEYQVAYYVADSFDDAMVKLRDYSGRHLQRPYELYYDPYTCSIRELDSMSQLDLVAESLASQVAHLSAAISKLSNSSRPRNHHFLSASGSASGRERKVNFINHLSENNHFGSEQAKEASK